MSYDKVVDSSVLDANLTIIANAIRSKGGTTENLSFPDGFVSAVQGIQTGGDGESSGVVSGSFTPSENTLDAVINIGKSFTHFIMFATGTVTGNSVKATANVIADLNIPYCYGASTNNAGGSLSVIPYAQELFTGEDGTLSKPFSGFLMNNTQVRIFDDCVRILTSSPAGSCLGYFIAGVTYAWYAW